MADITAATDAGNWGHGHVYVRPDGARARCGGPALCAECAKDAARKAASEGAYFDGSTPTAGSTEAWSGTTDAVQPNTVDVILPDDVMAELDAVADAVAMPLVMLAARLTGERETAERRARDAEALNNRLLRAIQSMVDSWPQTSWGVSEEARDTAQALLDEIVEGATMGSPEQPTEQETPHAPRRDSQQEAHDPRHPD